MLASHLVEDVEAPPNYSVRLLEREPGGIEAPRAFVLYRGQCLLMRTRRPDRVLRSLGDCLSSQVDAGGPRVRVRQAAVVGRSGAVILPHDLFWRLEAIESELLQRGVWLVDPPFVDIDTGTGELVLSRPPFGPDGGDGRSDDPARGPVPVGRHAIREWAMLSSERREAPGLREALATVLSLLDPDGVPPSPIGTIVGVLKTSKLSWIQREPPDVLLERLAER
jgi:hypothetical protein